MFINCYFKIFPTIVNQLVIIFGFIIQTYQEYRFYYCCYTLNMQAFPFGGRKECILRYQQPPTINLGIESEDDFFLENDIMTKKKVVDS